VVKAKGKKIETVPAVWPAMVDPEIFTRAQKVLEAGKKQKTGRESRYPYLLSTRIFCGECGVSLVGISAHGATSKVPYYGHSSQIKREQTLDERSHRCNPFRVPGRKLEDRVWKEVLSLIERPTHREPLFIAIQKLSESKPAQRQTEKLETELRATEGRLSNLAQRIADLPAGVPAQALYDEMKRLAENQTRIKADLQDSRRRGDDQRLAGAADFDRLLGKLRNQLMDLSPETKRRIIQTLIHKVVVTKDGFELHFYAGVDQIKKGEVIASGSSSKRGA
jgi:site-specific DNA recombinase